MRNSFAATAAMAMLLCACSTLEDPRYPSSQGWRTGEIQLLGNSLTSFPPGAIDCGARVLAEQAAAPEYAYVQFDFTPTPKYFGSNPKQRHIIVLVSPGSHFSKGERVRVNVRDCSQPPAAWNGTPQDLKR